MRSSHSIQKLLYCLAFLGGTIISHSIIGRDSNPLHDPQRLPSNDSLPHRNLNIDADSFENENILHPGERIGDKVRKNLFVQAQVSKTECFVGEPLIVTYKLYSRLNAESLIVAQPSLTGFNKTDLVTVANLSGSIERVDGKTFQVHVLRKTQLVPMIAGDLEVDPMEVEHKIKFIKSDLDTIAASGQLTDFLNQRKHQEDVLSTPAKLNTQSSGVRITVRDLPEENKPSTYTGAVGSFSIKASLSRPVKINGETAVITLQIKGKGSLLLTEPPAITLPHNIELFNVKPVINSHKTDGESNTSRSFEYLVVFRQPGPVRIPPIAFSFFDPSKRIYKTIHSMPIFAEVPENTKEMHGKSTGKESPTVLVKSNPVPAGRYNNFLLLAIIAIAGIVILFWKKTNHTGPTKSTGRKQPKGRNIDQCADTPLTRATERLKVIKDMDKNEVSNYYYELNKVLWTVIAEKISLLPTDLSKGNIFSELSRQGWTPEEVWHLELTMNEYERNLYIPGYHDENDFEGAYNKAVIIISKLEQLPPVSIDTIQNSN